MLQTLVVTVASAMEPGSQTAFLHCKDVITINSKSPKEKEIHQNQTAENISLAWSHNCLVEI